MIKLGIHSVPRSGSSWLGELINSSEEVNYSYQPLFSYEFKGALHERSSDEEIDVFFDAIRRTENEFIRQSDDRESGKKPVFIKNYTKCIAYKEVRYHYVLDNLLSRDPDFRLIALVRNPFSVLSSWYSAPREFRRDLGWEFSNEWYHAHSKNQNRKEEYFGFEKWVESTLLFHDLRNRFSKKVCLLSYESLVQDTLEKVTEIFDFLGMDVSRQILDFVNKSSAVHVDGSYSVYRKKSAADKGWNPCISREIAEEIIEVCSADEQLKSYLTDYDLNAPLLLKESS